jgi:hypothetical protein
MYGWKQDLPDTEEAAVKVSTVHRVAQAATAMSDAVAHSVGMDTSFHRPSSLAHC